MDFKKLTDRAKDLGDSAKKAFEDRGGTDALKQDLHELKDIATSKGSVSDKAKAAADALKHPGAHAEEHPHGDPETGAPPEPAKPGVHLMDSDEPEAPDAGLQPDPNAPHADSSAN